MGAPPLPLACRLMETDPLGDHAPAAPDDLGPVGGELALASPAFLRGLGRGLLLAQASLAGYVLIVILVAIAPAAASTPGLTVVFAVAANVIALLTQLAALVGWWLISSGEPDPEAAPAGADRLRLVVRGFLLASAAVAIAGVAAAFLGPAPPPPGAPPPTSPLGGPPPVPPAALVLGAINLGVLLGGYLSRMTLAAHVARRAGNGRAFQRAQQMLWLGPLLCTVGMMCVGVGPLIAIALYANLLGWLRADVRAALADRDALDLV
jgi:hypothetical protein